MVMCLGLLVREQGIRRDWTEELCKGAEDIEGKGFSG
jgi:hypothetical protein